MLWNQVKIGLLLVFMAAGFYACATGSAFKSKVNSEKKAEVVKKLEMLDVQYAILLKDNPSNSDTQPFRKIIAESRKALGKGDTKKALLLADEARVWIDDARRAHYHKHESRIKAGGAGKSARVLMDEAFGFKEKAEAATNEGDHWKSGQYFQAAMEQGELALLASMGSPKQALELIGLAHKMEAIYNAAGKTDQAYQSRQRVIRWLESALATLRGQINAKLSAEAPGYDKATLCSNKEAFGMAAQDLKDLDNLYKKTSEGANKYAPESIRVQDYTPKVNAWSGSRKKICGGTLHLSSNGGNEPDPERRQILQLIAAHNKQYKQGVETIDGTGILLVETDVYSRGGSVVVKGMVQNNKTEPIIKPQVVVTGQMISVCSDLGYESFNPRMKTTFACTLEFYSPDAFQDKGGKVPSHELVLIFKEQNGLERRVIQPVK